MIPIDCKIRNFFCTKMTLLYQLHDLPQANSYILLQPRSDLKLSRFAPIRKYVSCDGVASRSQEMCIFCHCLKVTDTST